jgi:hypothetical protein
MSQLTPVLQDHGRTSGFGLHGVWLWIGFGRSLRRRLSGWDCVNLHFVIIWSRLLVYVQRNIGGIPEN